jgi:CheY-like chemotaxis protein
MRILIVDDDQMVRTVCSGMLEILGHETVAVESGIEALKELANREAAIDLVILDDGMPELSGRETLAEMSARSIAVPVVICSGMEITTAGFGPSPEFDPVALLWKPFTMQTLKTTIDRVEKLRRSP